MRFLCLLLLGSVSVFAAGPPPPIQYNIFSTNRIGNTNQFTNTAGGVHLKNGVTLTNSQRYFGSGLVSNREPFWSVNTPGPVEPSWAWIEKMGGSNVNILTLFNKATNAGGNIFYWGDVALQAQSLRVGEQRDGTTESRITQAWIGLPGSDQDGEEVYTWSTHSNNLTWGGARTAGGRLWLTFNQTNFDEYFGGTNDNGYFRGSNVVLRTSAGDIRINTGSAYLQNSKGVYGSTVGGSVGRVFQIDDSDDQILYGDPVFTAGHVFFGGVAITNAGTSQLTYTDNNSHLKPITNLVNLTLVGGTLTASGGGGSGTSIDFDPNQLVTNNAGSVLHIKNGVLLTNVTVWNNTTNDVPFIVRSQNGGATNIFEFQNSAGAVTTFFNGAGSLLSANGSVGIGGSSQFTNALTVGGTLSASNRAWVGGTLSVGTNSIDSTNIFQVAVPVGTPGVIRNALEVGTNNATYTQAITNAGNIQSATLNTTGNETVGGALAVIGSQTNTGSVFWGASTNKVFGQIQLTNAANSSANQIGELIQDAFGNMVVSGTVGVGLGTGDHSVQLYMTSGVFKPQNDVAMDLGQSNVRWKGIYGTNVSANAYSYPMTTVAPTAALIGGTVGSVTNHMLKNVNGALTDYWSDGTTLYSKVLGP